MDGIIFDVDGTLWDSTDSVADAWNKAIRENSNLNLTLNRRILSTLFGKPMTAIGQELFSDLSEKEREKLLNACCAYENEYLEDHPGIFYDGVIEGIRRLSKKYPLYIVSNCQLGYIETVIKCAGIERCITDHLCFGETLTPKGQTILTLMKRNNLTDVIYVGDTQGDADACIEAGIPFIFAEYGFGDVPDASKRIRTFSELETLYL